MAPIAIVTDSTAYLPQALVDQYGISVAPQVLVWGERTYQDGVDIQPKAFHERLAKASVMPKSSQASPAAFEKVFRELLAQDFHVLTVVLSAKLSGTLTSALLAKENIGADAPIEVVDSHFVAMAMGFQALAAAKASVQGATLAECKALVEAARERCGIFLTVDTLEFLHRGGRIGGASRFIGTAFNIKPVLKIEGGRVEPVERVRTRSKALQRVVELVGEHVGQKPLHISALNANAPADAQQMLDMVVGRMNVVEHGLSDLSPVIGANAGPGTVGLAYMYD